MTSVSRERFERPKGGLVESGSTALAAIQGARFFSRPFIDGAFVDPFSDATFQNICPIDGGVLTEVALCGIEEVDRAVAGARKAFERGDWAARPPLERNKTLVKLAEQIETHMDEFAILEALDVGKPFQSAKSVDVAAAVETFKWYGELADKAYGRVAPTAHLDILTREPVGVVAAVTPWNYPLMIASWKIAPMLAAGNSVVVKPAEQSPSSALLLAALAVEAGVPPGVLNVVPGDGPKTGTALGRHMDVDAVGFTGSSEVGKRFLVYSGESNMKHVWLECGGKSPNIIFDDADVESAVSSTAGGVFYMAGQSCNAPTRLLVQQPILDKVLTALEEAAHSYAPNNPLNDRTEAGAIVSREQFDRIRGFIENATNDGARIYSGGGQLFVDSGGSYLQPTIVTETKPDMEINQEEIFGPVLPVITFADEDEAIAIANNSIYGLWANVWTRDLQRTVACARRIRAGTVAFNQVFGGDITTPMGGYKQSGIGRDRGVDAYEKYTQLKHIAILSS